MAKKGMRGRAQCVHHWVQLLNKKNQPIKKRAVFILKVTAINPRATEEGVDFEPHGEKGEKEQTLSCTLWQCKKCKEKRLLPSSCLIIVPDPSVFHFTPSRKFRAVLKK